MSRIHKGSKGAHGSKRPVRDESPEWVTMLPRQVESKVLELARQGMQPARIGLVLRDGHGVPNVHELTGKRIQEIIDGAGLRPKVPFELKNLVSRAISLMEHTAANPNDLHNLRGLELMEARIRRLQDYYHDHALLPEDWKYTRDGARLLVD